MLSEIEELFSKEGVIEEIRKKVYPIIVNKVLYEVTDCLERSHFDEWNYTEEIDQYLSDVFKEDPITEKAGHAFEVCQNRLNPIFEEVFQKVKKALERHGNLDVDFNAIWVYDIQSDIFKLIDILFEMEEAGKIPYEKSEKVTSIIDKLCDFDIVLSELEDLDPRLKEIGKWFKKIGENRMEKKNKLDLA